MKKVISIFLTLTLSISFSLYAFAEGTFLNDLTNEYDINSYENNYGLSCDSYPFLCAPKITGDFIQMWYCGAWDIFKWQDYFDSLNEAGIDTVVIQYTATVSGGKLKSIGFEPNDEINGLLTSDCEKYPNMLLTALTAAKVKGIKVIVGLSTNDEWWSTTNTQNDTWINAEATLVNKMAKCIYENYYNDFSDVFAGWYWAYEMWTCNSGSEDHLETKWAEMLNLTLDYLNELTPNTPAMICPYISKYYGTENADKCWREFFEKVHFKDGDIVAPQDCLSIGTYDLETVEKHISDMSNARQYCNANIEFWLDVENYQSGSVDNFIKQLRISAKYATKLLCFSYVHYYLGKTEDGEYKTYSSAVPEFEDSDTDTEIEAETDTETETEIETETDTISETDSQTDTETETETETNSDTEVETDTETVTEQETDTETISETETDDGTNTKKESDTDTYIDTETDTEQPLLILGDISFDGVVDIIDVALARAHIVGNRRLSEEQILFGDVNSDGTLDIIDVVIIRRAIVDAKK